MGSGSLLITSTVAANAPANTTQLMDLKTSPEIASVTTLQIPQGQTWIIDDLFILASADAGTSDPQLRFVKNQNIVVGQTPNISAMLVSNPSRPQLRPKLGFESASQLQVYLITTVANDANADAIKVIATLDKRY